ncbi:uncharacterized protein LOC115224679 [Octopus sinensis]|uniref:Uncharacterized protein LOC115224679 n=1 Tax=Octopus sinensis TaxID=2607531 RepID=A0A6P7TPQ1_9MOLL|nr:uncharacterized protein LOC115224679 [Octopus sinensis]
MMLLLYWSILVIIFPQLIITKATMWSVMLHFDSKYKFVHISLDKVKYVNITSEKEQGNFNTEFELDNATKPSFVESDTGRIYWATVQNLDLQENYYGNCPYTFCDKTMITLRKRKLFALRLFFLCSGPEDAVFSTIADAVNIAQKSGGVITMVITSGCQCS